VFTEEGKPETGASIGIALYPDNGDDAESLIKEADKAMYKVKKSGKNGFRFSDAAETSG
jgi:diguanylate cyclase (GGDEF)-like protein